MFTVGCYGINDEDSDSGKSSDTDSPMEAWFCDSCRAGKKPVSDVLMYGVWSALETSS